MLGQGLFPAGAERTVQNVILQLYAHHFALTLAETTFNVFGNPQAIRRTVQDKEAQLVFDWFLRDT
jgi:hypothetical protein